MRLGGARYSACFFAAFSPEDHLNADSLGALIIDLEAGMESTERGWPDAAQQQQMVHRQLTANFLNASLEWRRVFAEIWGTFLLVLVAAGGSAVGAISNGRVTLGMMVVAPGIMPILLARNKNDDLRFHEVPRKIITNCCRVFCGFELRSISSRRSGAEEAQHPRYLGRRRKLLRSE